MNKPNYDFYTKTYGGTANEAAFSAALSKALSHVNWLIGFNKVTQDTEEAYKLAVCACVDTLLELGSSGVGFSIGSFSVNRVDRAIVDSAMSDAASKYLIGTGLLFQGVG